MFCSVRLFLRLYLMESPVYVHLVHPAARHFRNSYPYRLLPVSHLSLNNVHGLRALTTRAGARYTSLILLFGECEMLYTPEFIRSRLEALREPSYAAFSAKLLPGVQPPLGVRLPKLRALAKEIAKSPDWMSYLETQPGAAFEERMLYGMTLGYARPAFADALRFCAGFVPLIDNWSICDSCAAGFSFVRADREAAWNFLVPYLNSEKEFYARFGLVMLLWHSLTPDYLERVLGAIYSLRAQGYYARMAAAWLLSEILLKYPEYGIPVLERKTLEPFLQNTAIRKYCESRRVTDIQRREMRALRLPAAK